MATRYIHKGLSVDPQGYGNVVPFAVDEFGNLAITRGTEGAGVFVTEVGKEIISIPRVFNATAVAVTLVAADSGTVVAANTTNTVTVTLPPTKKGLMFTLSIVQLTAAGGHNFTPNAVDKIFHGTKADAAALVSTAATDAIGDFVTLIGDGVDGWYVAAMKGTWL